MTTPPQCQVIHDEGVIHNDLKPENFVVMGARLKLIDFGIANKIEEEKTSIQRNMRCGTINYMAPETIETYENEDFFKVSFSLVPRLPRSGTRTLKLCRHGEPGIFCHVKSTKDRRKVDATLIVRGCMRLRTEKGTKVADNLLHISSYWALNNIHTER